MLTPTAFGGAEKVGLTLFRHIDGALFRYAPITLIQPWVERNPFISAAEDDGFACHKIEVARMPRQLGRDYFRLMRCFITCRSLFKKNHIDLLHANGYFADLIGIPAARSLGIPSLSTCHGFIGGDRKLRLYNWLDKNILQMADGITAVSDAIRNELVAAGIRPHRIQVIPNAVPIPDHYMLQPVHRTDLRNQFRFEQHDIVLGYIGRLSEEKGLDNLIYAAKLLVQEGMPIKLLLVGEGPQRAALEQLIEECRLKSHCVLTGFRLQAEYLIPAMDLFVLPSLTEGTPMALLEAMANGIPVIASAVGGIPNILKHKSNGMLIPAGQPESISQAVKSLLCDKNGMQRMGFEARRTILSKFAVGPWAKRYETIYSDLVARKNRRDECNAVFSAY